jgi:hypothetical protein
MNRSCFQAMNKMMMTSGGKNGRFIPSCQITQQPAKSMFIKGRKQTPLFSALFIFRTSMPRSKKDYE